jgi:hypothetical protein
VAWLAVATAGCKKQSAPEGKDDATGQAPKTAPSPAEQAERSATNAPPVQPHGRPGDTERPVVTPTSADGEKQLGPLRVKLPSAWKEKRPAASSGMRLLELSVAGDAGEAELVVYYFGKGGAGGVEQNLKRWYEQFKKEDGSSAESSAKTSTKTVSGFKVTVTDVSGRYVAAMRPGAAEKHDNPGYRMLAAIVETTAGPFYVKMVGPEKTVAAAANDFSAFIDSIRASP